jgi:hypothetical protein
MKFVYKFHKTTLLSFCARLLLRKGGRGEGEQGTQTDISLQKRKLLQETATKAVIRQSYDSAI